MTDLLIKKKLQDYIDTGDNKLLKLMYVVAKEYNEEPDYTFGFTKSEIKEFDKRRARRLSGESETYSLEEAKKIIRGKKKMK